jgi:hypothetical protein
MRLRFAAFIQLLSFALIFLLGVPALAFPRAKIIRIDPRAAETDGAPVLSTVIEIAESKNLTDVLGPCLSMTGNGFDACAGEALSRPRSLFAPYDFPEKNAVFTVKVGGGDTAAKFVSKHKWGASSNIVGVGTAWLVIIDVSAKMGNQVDDAKAVATALVNSMRPQDIGDVVTIGDGSFPSRDSKWQTAANKAALLAVINAAGKEVSTGRSRPLFNTIKTASINAFSQLGNSGSLTSPMHHAMVVLSSGNAGGDPQTNGAIASEFARKASAGRLDDNPSTPKTPLPVISIYFPSKSLTEELTRNARDFMVNLTNPDVGGYFNVVVNNGAAAGPGIVAAIRDRFDQMFLILWRVPCVERSSTQTFNLNFLDVKPQIVGDGSFANVPVGINPMTWPLDLDKTYTVQIANRDPVYPGGRFKIFGNFCWGSDHNRAQVYFIPAGSKPPPRVGMNDVEKMKKIQKQLVAMNMLGKPIRATDSTLEVDAPDSEKILNGSGKSAVVRIVVFDSEAKRMSGATATTILTLKATEKPFPVIYFAIGGFALVIILLFIIILLRGGGGGRRPPPAMPPPGGGFGGPPPGGGYGGPPPGGGYGGPPGAGPYGPPGGGYGGGPPPGGGYARGAQPAPVGYAGQAPQAALQPDVRHQAAGPSPAQNAYVPPTAMPAGGGTIMAAPLNGPPPAAVAGGVSPVSEAPLSPGRQQTLLKPSTEFLYGGKPLQYALTTGVPQMEPPPPNPYESSPPPSMQAMKANISGEVGTFTIALGQELAVGRDASRCQIVVNEPRVSALHGLLKLDGGRLYVRDDGSNNGIEINGTRVPPGIWTVVPEGSSLRFGPAEFNVHLE